MEFLFSLLIPSPYINLPQGLAGWLGWILLAAAIGSLLIKWRKYNKPLGVRARLIFFLLLIAVPLTSLFIGMRLPAETRPLQPNIPDPGSGPAVMIFSAVPWVLAAGLLGPFPAALLAFIAGLLQALWDTHNPFLPLELALIACLFGAAVNQRYRTRLYRALRSPLITAIGLSLVYPLIVLFSTPFASQGVIANRLDYALAHINDGTLAVGTALLVAGVAAQLVSTAFPGLWGREEELEPAPPERSLQARFLYSMLPLASFMLIALVLAIWFIAGAAARDMVEQQTGNVAVVAGENVPYFLQTGQSLITQIAARPDVDPDRRRGLEEVLAEQLRTTAFFDDLVLLDQHGETVSMFPNPGKLYSRETAPLAEQTGIQLALMGVPPVQFYTIPPEEGDPSARVSFIATVKDDEGNIAGALLGRSDLVENPFVKPVISSFSELAEDDGEGILLDEYGRVIYHPEPDNLMKVFPLPEEARENGLAGQFYDDIAPDGTRRLVYYQPIADQSWSVVVTVPASKAQDLALNIAAPLTGIILLISIIGLFVLRWGIGWVTSSLKVLAVESDHIAKGQLESPLDVSGEDEVGQLGHSFEQMRLSLKARLDELNRLLLVSQGVAASLEVSQAIRPVLEAALATGASAARIVLIPAVVPELDGDAPTPICFGSGPGSERFSYLDEQILVLNRRQERVILSNLNRQRLLNFPVEAPRPEGLLAIALQHENNYYGTLWTLYERPHHFTDEEIRFTATLASQAALAAANARLFLNAEIGRQRLAAILASTPDPVLVTDQEDRLLLANLAAWRALGLGMRAYEGQPVDELIQEQKLLELLRSTKKDKQSVEVKLPDGQIYLATASSVMAEGQRVGRVCTMRDITYFKELDALKSEFVATVSHDLRSPLTLMRGYATMLEMVGDLNEQQSSYVRKIVGGVESMSRLVNNLLDLGRIEAGVGLQLEIIPVHEIVERVTSGLQLQAAQKRIQLTMEIPAETTPLIEADQALLQQALHNLVENAIKYTRAEGKIRVCVSVEQNQMVFKVEDTGVGISPMDQQRLFEKFYRGAQQGSKDLRGTGLGLAIVKSIAERHGGKVRVESQLGKGSTFYLSIPLRQPRTFV